MNNDFISAKFINILLKMIIRFPKREEALERQK